ncbi:MAG: hypothetical protein HZB99_03285 [Candidatus Harrisonbacteria bacterium]|nr:hypothetical protein [Candidatus Harrisonbacteria bacterium]
MNTHNIFEHKQGAEHIATPVSIYMVKRLSRKCKHILEIGGGIGTLTYSILSESESQVDVYEDNDFCINELKKNLAELSERYTLLDDCTQSPPRIDYDLVIIDGGQGGYDCGYPGMTENIFTFVKPTFVYFEGVRRKQRRTTLRVLRNRYTIKIYRIPFYFYQDRLYKGGTLMRCYVCNSFVKRWVNYILNTIYESQYTEKFFGRIKPPV